MSIATENGFVFGKSYVLKRQRNGENHHKFMMNDVVEMVYDDGSESPKFRRLGDGETAYVHIDRLEEVKQEAAPLKNFIIDVTDVETTVRVGKLLSADQLKRIIEILGE